MNENNRQSLSFPYHHVSENEHYGDDGGYAQGCRSYDCRYGTGSRNLFVAQFYVCCLLRQERTFKNLSNHPPLPYSNSAIWVCQSQTPFSS